MAEVVFFNVYGAQESIPGMNSASLCSLAGRYDNPIPTPIDCLKIPALLTLLPFCLLRKQLLCIPPLCPFMRHTDGLACLYSASAMKKRDKASNHCFYACLHLHNAHICNKYTAKLYAAYC
jgi:hypothetical protein